MVFLALMTAARVVILRLMASALLVGAWSVRAATLALGVLRLTTAPLLLSRILAAADAALALTTLSSVLP